MLHICNIALAIALAVPAGAAQVGATAEVASDYRFRGLSLSNNAPVADVSVEASLASGWFAGGEVIAPSRGPGRGVAASRTAEIDLSAGWGRSLGLVTPTVGAIAYFRPDSRAALAEGFASVEGALGPATLALGINYAPGQAAAPGGNLYVFTRASAAIPLTPVSLHAAVGRERGGLVPGGVTKVDWRTGADFRLGVTRVGLDYVGSDLPRGAPGRVGRARENGVVARLGIRF